MIFRKFRHIHMTGIGGIGMSSIAEVLLNHGFKVTGSDLNLSEVTERLKQLGGKVFLGHSAENLGEAEVVVYSSACRPDNAEIMAAMQRKIPVIRRAEMLAELMRMKFGIAIAGTHGKTSTTTMAGAILVRGGLDPTVIVGGISPLFGSNARIGRGEFLVVEADEFDRSFLKLSPTIAVITTLELEHLDCYRDLEDLTAAFAQFAGQVPFYGTVILCVDEPGVQNLIPRLGRPILTYGLSPQADIQAKGISIRQGLTEFEIFHKGERLGKAAISVPGLHNVKNALAAAAVGWELELSFEQIAEGLRDFTGVKRRFQLVCDKSGILVYDDYAHHHTEVRVTLEAAKMLYDRRIIAVFQPHLYSRTRDFYQEFGKAFHQAEILMVTPIYPAREEPIPGISGEMIVEAARAAGHRQAYYVEDMEKLPDLVLEKAEKGDLIITMGAGSIWKYGKRICECLK